MDLSRRLFLLLLASSACHAAPKTYECPERVRLSGTGVVVSEVPEGFKGSISSSPVFLSSVSVFDGPPEQGAELVPVNAAKNASKVKWRFSDPSPHGIWLACRYADQLVTVAVKAEGEPAECEAQIAKRGSPSLLSAQFTCR